MPDSVFECRMCGQCCEGEGGIVLGRRDLERLAAFLGLAPEEFLAAYTFLNGEKIRLATGADGFCVFFKNGAGCQVHEAKPDICRAWPFFRGNIEDPHSLAMARAYCPGINPGASHSEFSSLGRRYLLENGLVSEDAPANALKIPPEGSEN